ncbi:hypothetical protein KC349_g101 [Hortaea werneckii]|nr:hypothetical protein KC349_g101 [Hortaea werneckii]
MNPEHLPTEDRPLCEAELEGMIADAAASRAPTRTTPPEAPTGNLHLRLRSSLELAVMSRSFPFALLTPPEVNMLSNATDATSWKAVQRP